MCRMQETRNMKLRKLNPEEHIRTRKLWEQIFTEDTEEFLDYYYAVKTKENEIYVIEDEGRIVSMLHLNPYQMRIGKQIYETHYIVAVATDERYRRRGLMARLLNHTLQVMAERGEPFTFLMPASEAIYKPFGFEFIYEQKRCRITGKRSSDASLEVTYAKEADCAQIAEFANEFLKEYDVVAWRDADYYKTLLAEQASEDGGVLIAKKDGKIEGVLCLTKEEEREIREPLFYKEETLKQTVYRITGNEADSVQCIGYGDTETKPMIMAKVLRPELAGDLRKANVFLNEVV